MAGSAAVNTAIAEENSLSGETPRSTERDDETADWTLAGYDNANTLYNTEASPPTEAMEVAWRVDKRARKLRIVDGRVHFETVEDRGNTHVLNTHDATDGSKLWSVDLSSGAVESIAVADGQVYVGHYDFIEVFDAEDGSKLWSTDGIGGNVRFTDRTLITAGQKITAVDREEKSIRWERALEVRDNPAILGETLYVSGSNDGQITVRALSLEDGSDQWVREFDTLGNVVATDSHTFFWHSNQFYALDAETGETVWMKNGGEVEDTDIGNVGVRAVGDGVLYARVDDRVGAYEPDTGKELWTVEVSSWYGDFGSIGGDYSFYTQDRYRTGTDAIVVRNLDGDVVTRQEIPDLNGIVQPAGDSLYVNTFNDGVVALRASANDGDSGDSSDTGGEPDDSSDGSDSSDSSDGDSNSDDADTPDVDDDC